MNAPVHAEDHPSGDFIVWHRAQVFKGRARPI
jgi:putative restriction endonuclease